MKEKPAAAVAPACIGIALTEAIAGEKDLAAGPRARDIATTTGTTAGSGGSTILRSEGTSLAPTTTIVPSSVAVAPAKASTTEKDEAAGPCARATIATTNTATGDVGFAASSSEITNPVCTAALILAIAAAPAKVFAGEKSQAARPCAKTTATTTVDGGDST
ncbi:hypothetical protein ACH5RR_003679 [Cinchona calisaya]|uniref:Uncharacterized protein n=1 Tax=Cinchona calisaya TaxID=153742 RepID=A0ABD3AVZ2_9GENT